MSFAGFAVVARVECSEIEVLSCDSGRPQPQTNSVLSAEARDWHVVCECSHILTSHPLSLSALTLRHLAEELDGVGDIVPWNFPRVAHL